jgi:hypothetical protein
VFAGNGEFADIVGFQLRCDKNTDFLFERQLANANFDGYFPNTNGT